MYSLFILEFKWIISLSSDSVYHSDYSFLSCALDPIYRRLDQTTAHQSQKRSQPPAADRVVVMQLETNTVVLQGTEPT